MIQIHDLIHQGLLHVCRADSQCVFGWGCFRYSSWVLLRAKSRPSVGCALHAAAAAALGIVTAVMNRAFFLGMIAVNFLWRKLTIFFR